MNDDEIVKRLAVASASMNAVDLATLLDELTDGDLSQGAMVMYFRRALPSVPLRVLLEAGSWSRLTNGNLANDGFNELLSEWLPAGISRSKDG